MNKTKNTQQILRTFLGGNITQQNHTITIMTAKLTRRTIGIVANSVTESVCKENIYHAGN